MNKINIKIKKTIYSFLMFFIIPVCIYAQDKIKVLDQSTKMPITGLHFRYSTKTGVSDNDGLIEIDYIRGENLIMTHVSYGHWTLSDSQVKDAIESKFIEREMFSVSLQPVTVVSLRQKTTATNKIELNYLNRQHHDGGAILNFDPAISTIRKSGAYGFDPVFRGFKYDQLNIVIDGGQFAIAACPNRMDPTTSQVALNMIEHIEVLKGPYSLRFGNSFGATINFISAEPKFIETFKPSGRISSTFENNGSILRSEGFIGGTGEKYDLKFFGSWSKGNDYKDGDGNKVPANMMRGSFGTILGLKLSDYQNIIISANRNLGRDTDFPALPMDLRKDDTWMFSAQHKISFRDKPLKSWKSMLYGTFVDHLMNNFLKIINPRTIDVESPTKTHTYGGRTEGSWNFKNIVLFAGSDLKIEGAEGYRFREPLTGPNAGKIFTDNSWQNSKITRSAVFAESRFSTENLVYVISGRMELNSSQAREAADEFTGVNPQTSITQVNPCLSLGGIMNFTDLFSAKLWLGRARRSGSLTERFINYFPVGMDPYELLGNPKIKPETNNQADLILEFMTTGTNLNIDIFASYIENYISSVNDPELSPRLPTSPGVRQFQNIGEAFKTGFEIGWKQSLFLGLQHQLGLAYTFGESLKGNNPLPEISPFDIRYSIEGLYLKNKLNPEISFRYVSKQNRVSEEFGETETPEFTTVDLRITYQIFNTFKITGGVQNLFDVAYYEHLNRGFNGNSTLHIYNPGRNLYLSLNFDIK